MALMEGMLTPRWITSLGPASFGASPGPLRLRCGPHHTYFFPRPEEESRQVSPQTPYLLITPMKCLAKPSLTTSSYPPRGHLPGMHALLPQCPLGPLVAGSILCVAHVSCQLPALARGSAEGRVLRGPLEGAACSSSDDGEGWGPALT